MTVIIQQYKNDSLKCRSKEHFWVCECLQCTELFIVYWFLQHFQTGTGRHAELFEILGQINLFNPIGRVESDPIERDIVHLYGGAKTMTGWQSIHDLLYTRCNFLYPKREERNSIGIMGYIQHLLLEIVLGKEVELRERKRCK